jgi:hypothetical protein
MSQPIHCKVSMLDLTLADRIIATLKYGEERKVYFTRDLEGAFFAHLFPNILCAKRTTIITFSESKIFDTTWLPNTRVSNMTAEVKRVFEKNLPQMKIINIDSLGVCVSH